MGSKSLRRKPAWEPEGAKAPVAEEAPEAAGAPRVPGALEALQGAWGKAGSWARRRLARAAAPLLAAFARMRGRRPLYTAYSLQALASNDRFSHDKATRELGYRPRDLRLTVRDTVRWLQSHGVQPRRTPRLRRRAARAEV